MVINNILHTLRYKYSVCMLTVSSYRLIFSYPILHYNYTNLVTLYRSQLVTFSFCTPQSLQAVYVNDQCTLVHVIKCNVIPQLHLSPGCSAVLCNGQTDTHTCTLTVLHHSGEFQNLFTVAWQTLWLAVYNGKFYFHKSLSISHKQLYLWMNY